MSEPLHIAIWNAVAADCSSRDLMLFGPEKTRVAVESLVAEVRKEERERVLAPFKRHAEMLRLQADEGEPTDRDREILAQLYADDGPRSEFEIIAAYREEIEKTACERVVSAFRALADDLATRPHDTVRFEGDPAGFYTACAAEILATAERVLRGKESGT